MTSFYHFNHFKSSASDVIKSVINIRVRLKLSVGWETVVLVLLLGSTLFIALFQWMADGAPGAYGLPVIKSVVKESVFALVPVQTRLPFMGRAVVMTIMSQGSVLLIDVRVSTMSTCLSVDLPVCFF